MRRFKSIRRLLAIEAVNALALLGVLLICASAAYSQSASPASTTAPEAGNQEPYVTMFPHDSDSRYFLSGQMNFIFQYHPDFSAKYSGVNSMSSAAEHATSRVFTLYTGYELNKTTEFIFDVESAGGHGLSAGAGPGGFTDLDIVRTPNLGEAPYLARLMVRHQRRTNSRPRLPRIRALGLEQRTNRIVCLYGSGSGADDGR